ncbi:MAG: B12-binding domain-containing radical SAM protein, partial [Vulcanibacillus sp.]
MKILLTTLNAKYIHTSLALRYLKAYSYKDFNNIEIIEYSINEPTNYILSDIYGKNPDVIGLSCYIWNIDETIRLVKLIKKVLPNIKVILGGPEVSFDILYWLNRVEEIDYIIYGEGELTLNQLLKTINSGEEYDKLLGIAYKDKNGVRVNPPQIKINLDDLPSPYSDINDLLSIKDKIVYFEASRGCPFSCTYCLSSTDNNIRFFSIERVKIELTNLINNGVKTIKFVDRTFNANNKFALEIFKFLIENYQGTVFQFEITMDIMDNETIDYLVNNAPKGIFRFEIGVQSTNENTNSLIKRRQNFKKLKDNVIRLKKNNNIALHIDLIAGLPEENYDSFRKTFNDTFELNPEELQLGFLKVLRGTLMSAEVDKYDYLYMDSAPYEVLQNRVLTYGDLIRIKSVEQILEKYWNSHRMDLTINYLLKNVFTSAYDFFQEFGDYWESKGWGRIGHQLESLFIRLHEFLQARRTNNIDFIICFMKLDYLLNHKYKPRKTWWEFEL